MYDRDQTARAESHDPAGIVPDTGDLLTKLLGAAFGAFLFSSAFSIAAAQVSLGICVLLYAAILLRQGHWAGAESLKPLFLVWAAYVAWLMIASFVNDNTWRSLNCIREEWLLVILPIGLHLTRRRNASRRLLLTLAVGVALISVYGIVQHFLGWRYFNDLPLHKVGGSFRLSGNFSHPLTFGYYVVTATVFFVALSLRTLRSLDRWSRLVLPGTAILGLLAAALCNSRGPMLALIIGLMFAGLMAGRLRWAVVGLGAVVIVALTLSPNLMSAFSQRVANDRQSDNPAGRLFIWKHAGQIALENPVFGCGPGNFGAAYADQLQPEYADSGTKGHAHNDFIHQATVAGFPGAILLAAFWGVALRRFWRLRVAHELTSTQRALAFAGLAASVAFLAGSMTECAFADEELRQLLMGLWVFAWDPRDPIA